MRDLSPPTQELEPAALAMAADIRARLGPALFEAFDDDGGFRAWPGADRVWSRAGEAPVLRAEAEIDAPPLVVAAVVKEADLGGLAGDLLHWRVGRMSPFLELVHYVNRYPPPFAPRDFCVLERYGVEGDGSVLILGEDLDPADGPALKPAVRAIAKFQEKGAVRGSLRRSGYRIEPLAGGTRTRLRRWLEVDLCMWVPAAVCERLLVRGLQGDFARLRAQAAAFAGSALEKRTEADWFYKVVRNHAAA